MGRQKKWKGTTPRTVSVPFEFLPAFEVAEKYAASKGVGLNEVICYAVTDFMKSHGWTGQDPEEYLKDLLQDWLKRGQLWATLEEEALAGRRLLQVSRMAASKDVQALRVEVARVLATTLGPDDVADRKFEEYRLREDREREAARKRRAERERQAEARPVVDRVDDVKRVAERYMFPKKPE